MEYLRKQNLFKCWMRTRGLSESSISKYAVQSHNKVLKTLGISFYELDNTEELSELLSDVRKLEKYMEKDPRRMYSAAINNYIKFKCEKADAENTVSDIEYESKVEETVGKLVEKPTWNSFPQPRAKLISGSSIRYERKAKVGADAIVLANFKCQINSFHNYFTSRKTHMNYVEAHHLIPIAYQGLFEFGIDEVENIAALCPVCHKCIHYGENNERTELLVQLHKAFQPELNRISVKIKEKELLDLYKAI